MAFKKYCGSQEISHCAVKEDGVHKLGIVELSSLY